MTLWINGDWVTGEGDSSETNPVGSEVLWKTNDASAGQVEQALPRRAPAVSGAWAKQPFTVRGIVESLPSLLEANKTELTHRDRHGASKPRWEAATEVTAMINKSRHLGKGVPYPHRRAAPKMADGAATPAPSPPWRTGGVWPYNFQGICQTGILCPHCWRNSVILNQ